jgi:DNA polymerase III delta subunit
MFLKNKSKFFNKKKVKKTLKSLKLLFDTDKFIFYISPKKIRAYSEVLLILNKVTAFKTVSPSDMKTLSDNLLSLRARKVSIKK